MSDQTTPFALRLDQAIARLGSLVCVGLDPQPDRTPGSVVEQCVRVIDATYEAAVAFKPNSAFFEAVGVEGMRALAEVIDHVPDDRLVILDGKRGDIGHTAAAYAHAAFEVLGADALTVSPYLGGDAVAPFLANPARGAFVLCHTSNPGAKDLQELEVAGRPLYLLVASLAVSWNARGNVGLVVGATFPQAVEAVRSTAPELPLLVPGVGAQGGDLAAIVSVGLDARGRGMLVSSSRAVFYDADPGMAARRLRDEINAFRSRRWL